MGTLNYSASSGCNYTFISQFFIQFSIVSVSSLLEVNISPSMFTFLGLWGKPCDPIPLTPHLVRNKLLFFICQSSGKTFQYWYQVKILLQVISSYLTPSFFNLPPPPTPPPFRQKFVSWRHKFLTPFSLLIFSGFDIETYFFSGKKCEGRLKIWVWQI